jgi:4-hydroxybenzoate polyprenyltransferase
LVIDLDGTLVCTNMLIECALSLIKQNPLAAFQMLAWLSKGRAHLKQELARRVPIDTAALPINAHVKAYGAGEKSRGRQVYLATAADRSIAQPIADHCGFFDGVLASDGRVNLKGERKAEALGRLFPAGFAYAGDSRADIPIWARASEIILVGASRWTRRAVEQLGKPTYSFPTPSRLGALIACARPHQWAKNSLVFVPAILSGAINAPHVLLATALSFAALCLVASSTYIINDLWDVADDRKHWSKRHRPIASGALPMSTALIASPVGLAAGLLLAMTAAPAALGVLLVYLVLTLAYSFAVKRVPVLDVTTLAGLFTLRLVLGIVSADVFASPWLLVFSMFLFSSLCFAKRYVEIQGTASRGQAAIASRGYRAEDAPLLFSLGLGAGISSIAIMVLYIMFDAFQRTFYGNTAWLWVFPLTLFLWISRIWLLAGRGQLHDDPVAFAVGDTVSLLLGCAMFAAFLLAWSGVFA